jgi:hypothetical protein
MQPVGIVQMTSNGGSRSITEGVVVIYENFPYDSQEKKGKSVEANGLM